MGLGMMCDWHECHLQSCVMKVGVRVRVERHYNILSLNMVCHALTLAEENLPEGTWGAEHEIACHEDTS